MLTDYRISINVAVHETGVTVHLVPRDTLLPLKVISCLFFFYNYYSATYFIALKMIFFV